MTPLRRRLFILSVASVIPLAALAASGLRLLRSQQYQEIRRIGLEMSRSIANTVNAELQTPITVLTTISSSPILESGDLPALRTRLASLLRQQPGWYGVLLTSADGTILLDTRDPHAAGPAPADIATELLESVVANRSTVGHLVRDRRRGWYFPVHVPVTQGGRVRYVLSALVSPTVIRDSLTRQRVPGDWVVSIVDQYNVRVARSRAHEETLGGRLSTSAEQVVMRDGPEGFGESTSLEGERIYTPYSRLANGWAAVLGLPTAQADAAVRSAILVYGGGVLLSIGLGLLGAAWVGRTITRPMADLRAAAVAVGQGLHPTMPVMGIREINDVGAALMTAAHERRRSDADRDAALARETAARQAAEAADRSKEEFLGILSHELRTPLNAVFGWARMLQAGQVRDEAGARDAIVRNTAIQRRMIDDLLDLSRITSGKLQIDPRPVNLVQIVHAAIEAVRPAAGARQIALDLNVATEVAAASGDPERLQQVFWNLLMNAVKFTPPGGQVHISVQAAASELRVTIRDTGEGIAPEVLPHVFERFRQGDSSSTRLHGGLGLGLSLVKYLTEMHGGHVQAASPGKGQGATFTVTLPMRQVATAVPAAPSAPGVGAIVSRLTRLDGLRIVVVDDDEDGRALARAVLTEAGAEVVCAASAEEALALVRGFLPDVLVSDIGMPVEDGYALIERVRALPLSEGGSVAAVALTAYGRPQDSAHAIAAGFNLHVAKPVDPAALTAAIEQLRRQGITAART